MTIEEQRRKLARWLAEWQLEKELPDESDSTSATCTTATSDSAFTVEATGVTLAPGDIVLLPPIGETTTARPVYVTLVEKRGGQWTAVPFSRFSLPATEEELATLSDFDPVKVLCLWNAGTVPETVLAHGWPVGKLKAADLKTMLAFLGGKKTSLPDDRRGPPLSHPLDPRHDYIEEEKTLWFDFVSSDLAASGPNDIFWAKESEDDYPAAAEERDENPFKPKA